ncbi:hypothetical protein ACFX15_046446 [Malus domestica]
MEVTPMVMTFATNRRDFPSDIQGVDEEPCWPFSDVILCASVACFDAPSEISGMLRSGCGANGMSVRGGSA